MENLRHILKELGLNEKEVSIYIYLLTTACSPASSLARNLMIKRPTCYNLIDGLVKKGFISQIVRNNMQYFFAVDPVVWMENYGFKQSLLLKKIDQAKTEINSFAHENWQNQKPSKASYFSGKEGITQILMDVLTSENKELRAYVSKNLSNFIDSFIPGYEELRAEKEVQTKAIYTFKADRAEIKNANFLCKETKYLSDKFDFGIDFLTYGNKHAVISVNEKFGLIIDSNTISKAHQRLFDLLWKFAKSPSI